MAIYQPSNVIPSSFAGINEQTVDASKEIRISWQVNGNSPMTGFRIKIYNNATTTTTPVKDTGILQPSNLPFYGVDNKGNPQQYIYEPKDTNNVSVKWSAWGLANNNEYKMEITQYWGTPTVNSGVPSYPDSQTVTQWSGSVFLARETPTVSINFSPALNSSGVGGYAKQTFLGTITPSSTGINSVRWQLYQVKNGEKIVLEDTGAINTGVIQYEYTGLKTGETYSINCIVVTQDNVEVSSGWQDFPVLYQEATNTGELTVKCLADDSNLLSWQKALDVPGVFSPSYATPSIDDGILNLSTGQSVSWNKVDNEAMSFSSPWNAVVKGKPSTYYTIEDISSPNTSSKTRVILSPNKKLLVVISLGGTASIYNISTTTVITLKQTLTQSGTMGSFSFDGNYFVLNSFNNLYLYSVSSDGSFVLIDTLSQGSSGDCITFSPTTYIFFLSGDSIYRIVNNKLQSGGKLSSQNNTVGVATFSADGNYLYWATNTWDSNKGYKLIKVYVDVNTLPSTWQQTTITYTHNIISQLLISPVDETLLIGIEDSSEFLTILVYDKYGVNEVNTTLNEGDYYSCAISPDGTTLICPSATGSNGEIGIFSITGDPDGLIYNKYSVSLVETISAGAFCCAFYDNNNVIFGGSSNISNTFLQNGLVLVKGGNYLDFRLNGTKRLQNLPTWAWLKSENNMQTIFFTSSREIIIDGEKIPFSAPEIISSISIYGEGTFDYIYITQDDITYTPDFTPVWDSKTLFFANFTTDLQGGTLSTSGDINNVLYRVDADGNLSFLASVPTAITKIKDYGIRSANKYSYQLYYLDENSKYSTPKSSGQTCRQFRAFSLIEASQNENNPNVYEVVKVWRFGNNLSTGSISNNNSPNWLTNFTPYRLRQPSARNGQSGTLQALLSNYNQSKNFYEDTVALMDELKQASLSTNTFFLKDMKGNLYMVGISGPITQTVNIKSKVQEVTISVPWEEVGDASNVSLIQYVTDDSQVKEDEVLSVVLSVNPTTGMLSATYPQNYYGTEFSLYALTPVEVDGQILFKLENGSVTATKNNK